MTGSSYADEYLDSLASIAKQLNQEGIENSPNMVAMRGLRNGLMDAGMSPTSRDKCVAASEININTYMDDAQLKRLEDITYDIGYDFYSLMSTKLRYNDDAIALMGRQIIVNMS